MNLPHFFVCKIGIERNRQSRPVCLVTIGKTRLTQIEVERSEDRLATGHPQSLQRLNKTMQAIRVGLEARQPDYKSIVSMGPARRHARQEDGFSGQGFPIGCGEKTTPFLKGFESSQLRKPERSLQICQLQIERRRIQLHCAIIFAQRSHSIE